MWRLWEEIEECFTAATLTPMHLHEEVSLTFTVMSYNILAQYVLEASQKQKLYTHCPKEMLDWGNRCRRLLEEIHKWSPDILCLQQVQENHYIEQLHPALTQMGYTCLYKRRTGTKADGCATCYRHMCFFEVTATQLEFFRPETELLTFHNVGVVLLLRPVVTKGLVIDPKSPLLCVANTNLLFSPKKGDAKLAQLAIILAEIDRMVSFCRTEGEYCNVILCGDLNALPRQPLYQLITTGKLCYDGLPSWVVSGQKDWSGDHDALYRRLTPPLWPSCLNITDKCQYTTAKMFKSQNSGKLKYTVDFLFQLRFCPDACVRPPYLALIEGVTDNTPDISKKNQPSVQSFRNTITHQLDLESVYKHQLSGSGRSEVTTLLDSGVAATTDYIFYSPKRISTTDQKAPGHLVSEGLKLIGRLSLLSEDVVWSMKGLPNHMFPSNHLSLVAKFQLNLNVD